MLATLIPFAPKIYDLNIDGYFMFMVVVGGLLIYINFLWMERKNR